MGHKVTGIPAQSQRFRELKKILEDKRTEVLNNAKGTNPDAEVFRINAALQRLEQGRYGNCSACGDPIPPQRLSALPFAVRCKDCEELLEFKAAQKQKPKGPARAYRF